MFRVLLDFIKVLVLRTLKVPSSQSIRFSGGFKLCEYQVVEDLTLQSVGHLGLAVHLLIRRRWVEYDCDE